MNQGGEQLIFCIVLLLSGTTHQKFIPKWRDATADSPASREWCPSWISLEMDVQESPG